MIRNRPSLPPWSPRRLTMALEPRHLFDGAAPAEAAVAVQDDGAAAYRDAPAPVPAADEAAPRELIVVDSRVAQDVDVEKLLAGPTQVVRIDQRSDGLAQLAAALEGKQNLAAIHILSHGARDGIVLGQGLVSQQELQRQSAVLASIGAALAADGDILLYGCDVAADNREFVDTLSTLTQADVAASTDATGSAALGGNWVLEASTGPIETSAFALSGFEHLLAPPSIVDGGGTRTTSEDTALAVTGVSVADADIGDVQTVTVAVTGGTVTVSAGSGAVIAGDGSASVIFSGTLTQVNNALNGMSFAPTADYFGAASIAVSTDDGSGPIAPTSIALTVTPVDDQPVGTADAIAATEDAAAVIGNVLANDINLDLPIDTLSVIALRTGTVAAGSGAAGSVGNPLVGTYGTLTVNANGAYSYTLDNTLATVQALPGRQTVSESFAYTLSDGLSSAQTDITVTVTGSNDAPAIVGTPAALIASSIPENATSIENPGALVSTLLADVDGNPVTGDVDAGTVLGVAIYASSVTNGMTGIWQYSLDGGASWTPAAAFSPAAALLLPAAAKLRFVADSNVDDAKESGIASIEYYAWDGSDGAGGGATANVAGRGGIAPFSTASLDAGFIVSARNDVPTLTPVPLVLNEGGTATITATELPVVDQDNQSDQLTYRVEALPVAGVLLKNGIALSVAGLFTQDDVLAGNISYRHTAGELSADASDSISFSLRDGAGGEINPVVLPITIRDVNAQIAITGTAQTLPERIGSEASDFAVLNLGLSDADGDPNLMTLTITSLPNSAVGRLQYWNGSAYVDVTAPLSLRKADLLAKPLHFISSGAEPAAVSGSGFAGPYQPTASFVVEASDNNPALTPTTVLPTVVTLTIEARNDAPTPVTNLLSADQGGPAAAITPAFLTSTDPDSDAGKRVYTVNSFPSAGLLRLGSVIIGVGSTFTQDDLIAGRLTYTHDGGAIDGSPLTADDHFDFSVNDRDGAVSTGTLDINVDSNNPIPSGAGGTLRAITPEGLFATIDTTTLAGSTGYAVLAVPAHGALYLDGGVLGFGGFFSAADLAAGRVVYVNGGDEPSAYGTPYHDTFQVTRSGGTVSGSSTIDLIVTPVDDAPTIDQAQDTVDRNQDGTTLMEDSAVSASDATLAGVTNAVKLTLANLQFVDPDTDPAALTYVLETAPLGGELRHWDGGAWVALAQNDTFAALDVGNGNIAYFHDAGSELRTDSITVHLRDGGVVQVGDVLFSGATISEQGFVTVNDLSNTLTINKGEIARSPSRTVTFTVANVNDAPVATDGTFTVDEGYNIGMGGPDNNAGRIRLLDVSVLEASDSDNSLSTATYTIVSLPTLGALEVDRGSGFTALAAGDQFTHAMLTGGKLRYVQNGSDASTTDSFTWSLNDNSAVAPVNLDSNVATVNISILPQNDPPVIFNNNGTTVPEGGVRHITTAMLGSPLTSETDADNTQRQTQFRVTAATQSGTLYLEKPVLPPGSPPLITVLGVGASFTLGDIQDGYLKYRHNGSETPPSDHFDFVISDGSGSNEPVGTFTIGVTPVNDAPQLSGLNPLTYFEDDGATLIDTSVIFNDVDLANGASYNAGTTLTIAYTSGGTVGDQLSVRDQGTASGQVSVAGSTVSYNFGGVPVPVGTIDGSLGGVNGAGLRITFNTSANVAAVKAVLENLSFHNTDTANASQGSAQATRSLSYTFVDGGGTALYVDDAGTTLQGADTVTASNTIVVKQRNDAPLMTNGDTVLTPISEDETVNGGSVKVIDLIGGSSDVDNAAVKGIAVTSLVAGNGSWQFSLDSTDGSNGSWSAIGSISVTSSLLLDPTAWLRFIPDGQNATTATFTYRAWDQTAGSIGGRANSTPTGGTTAFSTEDNVVSLVVTAVNDAPVLADTALSMTQREDAGPPVGAAGTLLSSLIGGVSDVDSGALQGLAVIGANTAEGTWHFSIDGGTNWLLLGAPLPGDAVLLATDALTRIYFEPNANYNGTQASALTVRAWDQTTGFNGATIGIDTTVNGTTTAFSTATDTVSLTVTALNDAPTISTSTSFIDTGGANENIRIPLGPVFTVGDADLARLEGSNLGQITLAVPHGSFVFDTSGVNITAGSQATDRGASGWGGGSSTLTFTGTLAALQTALNTVEYVPGDNPDTSETITVTFNDLNNAGAGAASGGSDDHSASTTVRIDNIAPVNDPPTISRPATVSATEDVEFGFTGGNTISIADVDARNGTVEVALSIPTGSLTLTQGATIVTGGSLGSSAFTLQGTVSAINGALATLRYTSALDDNSLNVTATDRTLTIAVSDLGNSVGNASTTPGTASATTLINVAAVNDTPTLDVDAAGGIQTTRATTTVGENATTAIIDIVLADDKDIRDGSYGSGTNIVVTALHGTLALNLAATGVVANANGRSITLTGSIADINTAIANGYLEYTPDSNFSGNDNLDLVFHDAGNSGSGGDKTAAASIPLLVSGVNDAPGFVALGGGSVGFTEDGAPVVLDVDATLTDPELVGYDNWGGAVLTLQRTAALGNPGTAVIDDAFGVTGSGSVGVNFNGTDVRIGATVVGTIITNAGGVLTIRFNDATSTAQANLVLQAVTYSNSNDNPPTQVTIGYTINDGNTNTGSTAQGTGNPLALEGSGSVDIAITATNDAPVLTAGSSTASFFEDDIAFVSALPPATISDPELSFFAGGNGDWGGAVLSLNRDGGANTDDVFGVTGSVNFSGVNVLRIGTVGVGTFTNAGGAFAVTFYPGTTSAQVQEVADGVTYSNTRQSLGDSQSEFITMAWTINDGNAAVAGAQGEGGPKQDTLVVSNGITLRGLNDAPVLADTLLAIGVPEDSAAPVGAVGILVSSLTGGVSDVDMTPVKGIAITHTNTTLGTWLYTVDGGTSWTPIGSVADNGALLLRDSDRLYFRPNTDTNGNVTSGLSLRAWDQTGGSAGTKVNASSNGNTTPFSTATDSVSLTVSAENDAPTRSLASVALASSLEDAASPSQGSIAALFAGAGSNAAFSDAKDDQTAFASGSAANSFAGIVITGNAATVAEGTWQYSANGSSGWTNISTALTSASGLFLPGSYALRFQAAADWNGTPGSLTVRLADDSAGSLPAAGDSVDVSNDSTLSGGSTRYSNSANAVTLGTSITSVNDAPAGADKTITAIEDTAHQFQAGDFGFTDLIDSPANSLDSVLITTLPATGTLRLSGSPVTVMQSIAAADLANLTWTPPADLNGSAVASFTFQVVDDGGVLNGGINTDPSANTITFDVSAVVDIVDDTQTTDEDTAVTTNILSNDNFQGTPTVTGVTQGAHGTVVNNNNGTVTYTPNADYNGSDSYTYTVTSPTGVTETATVNVTINPVVDITNDSVSTNSTASVTFDSLTGTNGARADNFEDPAAAITAIGTPANGSAVLNGNGTITYTPTPGYVGADSFTYTVTSGGVIETATISVNVTNAAPVANPDTASVPEDTPVSGNVLSNDSDSDPGDSKTVTQFVVNGSTVAVPAGAVGGSTNIAGVGALTVKADGSYSFTPMDDWNGSVPVVSYTVRDIAGATASSTLGIIVTPVADITDDSVSTNSTASVTFDPLTGTNGATADSFEDAAAAITAIGTPGNGSAVLNGNGTITYTPTPGYVGPDSFTYTVTSGGVSETATISVNVSNAAPVASPETASTPEDTPVSGNVLSNDSDSDPGDSLTVTQFVVNGSTVAVPAGAVGGSTSIAGVGTLTLKADGSYSFTPLADWNGSVPVVTYTVTDVAGATASNTLGIIVTPVVDITDDNVTTNSTASVTFDPLTGTNGATADNFENTAAAITAIGTPANGSAVLNGNGTITYTPTPGYVGPDSFIYTVTSGGVSETATISVNVSNAAPVANPDTASAPEDTPVSGNVLANDTDSDPGDSLTVTQFVVNGSSVAVPAGPTGGTATIAGVGTLTVKGDGSYSFTPLADWNGSVPVVTYTVRDTAGATASSTLAIVVTPVVDVTDDNVTTSSTAALVFDPLGGTNGSSADNFENAAAAITAIGNPAHGTAVLNGNGTITYTPTPGYVGADSFTYTVSSGGVSETATISINVTNAAPVANPDAATTPEDTPASGNVLANDSDADPGDSKTVTQFVVNGVTVTVPAGAVGGSTLIAGVGSLTLKADGSYSFTPVDDWNGSVPVVTYTVRDIAGATASSTLAIIVTAVADITDDSLTTNSTAALNFNALTGTGGASADNFEDPAAAITAIGNPGHGTAVLNGNGTITYTPTPGYVGADSFSYTVSSGGVSETATVSINVTNAAPVANPDAATTPEDTPVSGNLLGNDTDADPGDSKTITQFVVNGVTVAVPAGAAGGSTSIVGVGNLTVKADGSYSFTPVADWNGSVPVVTYTVRDIAGATASSTLAITVTAVADITGDSVTTNSTAALSFDPLTGTNGASADNFEDPAAAITAIGTPAHGSAVLNGNGSITYTPTPGYVGPDSFSYTVSSGGVSETATITVNVSNAAPVANPDTASTLEDTPVSGNVLSNDTDSDPGDRLSVTQFVVDGVTVVVPAGAGGVSTAIAGVGSVTVTADGSYVFTPLANWNGTVPRLTYTTTDTAGATASSTLSITVGDLNDPPTAMDDRYDTTDTAGPPGGTPINGNVLVNDTDPDAGTTLTVVAVNAGAGSVGGSTAGSFGSLTLNADGTFSYAVDQGNATVLALLRGQSLTDTFSYTITDGAGATSTATISFTIHGTNDAASAGNDSNTIAEEQVSASGNVISGVKTSGGGVSSTDLAARDIDPNGDPLTVVAIMLPGGSAGSIGLPFAGNFGAITLAPDGGYNYALDNTNLAVQQLHNGETLSESFVYTTDDGRGSLVDATITITISGINDQPLAVADVNSIAEDAILTATGKVLLNDTDADSNTALTVAAVAGSSPGVVNGRTTGSYGTLTLNADGSYSYLLDNGNGAVQALAPGQTLTDTFTYTASDGEGGTASATLTITIDGRNDPPLTVADTASSPEDTVLTGNVLANDSDPDNGDSLVLTQFVVDGATVIVPAGAVGGSSVIAGVGTLTVTADGSYSFTPLPDWNGSVPVVTYTVRDTAGATTSDTLRITVTPIADIAADNLTTNSTAAVSFDPLAGSNGATADKFEDPTAAITAVGTPGHGTAVLNPDGTISYTPTPGYVGPDSFSYTVSSGGVSETATISVNVTNAAPIANADTASTPEDTPLSGNVLANDSDSDPGDRKTISQFVVDGVTVAVPAVSAGATTTIAGVGTLTVRADGSYTFAPLADWNGNVPLVTYTVRDTAGATASSTLAITVTPVADNRVPPYVFADFDPAHWLDRYLVDRIIEPIAQPFVPAEYVLRQVSRAQDSLAEAAAELLRLYDPAGHGEIRALLRDFAQTLTPKQFVLDQGVAFSRQLLAELNQRALLSDRMATGGETLYDDLSIFSPLNISLLHDTARTGADVPAAERTVVTDPAPAASAQGVLDAGNGIGAMETAETDALPSPVYWPTRPPAPVVARSFSEQIRQSQSERRRVPLL